MLITSRNPRLHPDIKTIAHLTADKLDGDGVFEDSDLVRIPYDGFLLVNGVVTATGDSKLYVPQIHHQENRYNNIPVLNSGVHPAVDQMLCYKIPVHRGETPRILYDEVSDTAGHFAGYFFRGLNIRKVNNPIALNTPDVLVFKQISATAQNVLEDTDLEDFPLGGELLVWASSSGITSTIQLMQKGHQTGNTSIIPSYASGLACDCSKDAPYSIYVPATGNPTVTVTVNNSETVTILAALFVDWASVSPRQAARMGY